MEEMIKFLTNPLVWKLLGSYWLLSAIVGAMKTPTTNSPEWYQFLFRFSHLLSGNINRAALALKVPGAESEKP